MQTIAGPSHTRFVILALGFGAAIVSLWSGLSAASLSFAAAAAGISVFFAMRIAGRAVFHTADQIVVRNHGEDLVVEKAGASVAIREVEQYGFRGHRQHVTFVKPSQRPEWDNTKTAKRYIFVVPADPSSAPVAVEAGIGKTPKRLQALVEDIEAAIAGS